MSCGNSKQELERAGVNALAICRAPYRNSDGIVIECGCPFSEHLYAPVQGNYSVPVNFIEPFPSHICILFD
jgi:hypothetical protein